MSIHPDSWLGDLFGHHAYRVCVDETLRDLGAGWLARAIGGGDAFAFTRVPAEAVRQLHELEAEGLQVVDLTIRLSRRPVTPLRQNRTIEVREARDADYPRIIEIAGSAIRYSRFHLDPHVPRPLANRIKEAWMESYRAGRRGAGCLVAVDGEDVLGFLGLIETRGEPRTRVIDLMAVDTRHHRRGVGRALVESFVEAAAGRVETVDVGTQAANRPSVRLYESCGFRLAEAAYVLHAHFRNGVPVRC